MYEYPDHMLEPEFKEAEPSMYCMQCGEAIYCGDTYYNVDDDAWCVDCFNEYALSIKRTA